MGLGGDVSRSVCVGNPRNMEEGVVREGPWDMTDVLRY